MNQFSAVVIYVLTWGLIFVLRNFIIAALMTALATGLEFVINPAMRRMSYTQLRAEVLVAFVGAYKLISMFTLFVSLIVSAYTLYTTGGNEIIAETAYFLVLFDVHANLQFVIQDRLRPIDAPVAYEAVYAAPAA